MKRHWKTVTKKNITWEHAHALYESDIIIFGFFFCSAGLHEKMFWVTYTEREEKNLVVFFSRKIYRE